MRPLLLPTARLLPPGGIVVADGELLQRIELINPVIPSRPGSIRHTEGCLSLPGCTAHVERATKVEVGTLDRQGEVLAFELTGLAAIAAQHEIDHLEGKCVADLCGPVDRDIAQRKMAKARREAARAGCRGSRSGVERVRFRYARGSPGVSSRFATPDSCPESENELARGVLWLRA